MKILYISVLSALSFLFSSCGPTPESLAEQSHRLHDELKAARTQSDSDSIYREISYIETYARRELTKTEFKEYARMAHGDHE